MLKTLDLYIIRKFLSTFFFTVLIFTMISGIIDFSEKVEKFIESDITRKEIYIDYYPNFLLYIDALLWPLYTLIAVIFFTSRMAYNSEIISIFNAGVSFPRLMRPYLIAATLIAGLHIVGNHYFIPKGNKTRLDIVHTYIWQDNDKGKTQDVHMFLSPDTKVYINYYRKRDSTARKFRLEKFKGNELVYLLKANTAEWEGPPNKWKLRNYEIRTFNGMKESLIIGNGKEIDTTLALTPADFVDFKEQQTMMTSVELKQYIRNQKARGVGNTQKYEIELYRRSAEPFTIYILTIIGMAIAARKVRGGIGLHLAMGIGIGALYIFFSRFAIVFATGQAIPILAGIWLPNIVFSAVAAFLVRNAQK
ncbi:MAG: LptF/LptG family permease [Lewinellaceae bacterium]|nr:LptF/LptG family permease [Phaeodactylibacter sp.]MCB9038595.1 LptF/LptG family permease [Lewinellaceae bacterium]